MRNITKLPGLWSWKSKDHEFKNSAADTDGFYNLWNRVPESKKFQLNKKSSYSAKNKVSATKWLIYYQLAQLRI